LETVKGLEDQAAKGWVLGVISLHFTGNGQWELAEKLSFEGLNIANKLGGFRLREEEAIARAYFLLFSASRHEAWEDARYLFTQMTEWAGQRGNTQFVVNGQLGLAQLSLFRNRSAEECLHRSQLLLKDVTDAQTPALFYSLLALQQYRSSSKEALETAKKAMSLCPNATPTSFLIFNGYCCLAEVFVLMALQEPSLIKEAENACGMVTRFTRSFPICRPRASVYEGWRHWLRGRKEKAVSCWERALKESEQLKMDYDQGIALHLLARHGKRPDAKEKAEAIFRRLEAVPIGVGLEEGQSH
jgi:tetratricopeptide (TPR) repeat protein